MRKAFLTGGFVGFVLTFVTRMTMGAGISVTLRDSMIGCILMAFVFQIFYKQVESSVLEVLRREAEREAKMLEEEGSDG